MDDIIAVKGLDAWFAERLRGLRYRPETVAYVTGVLKALGHPRQEDVFVDRSVLLAYDAAVLKSDFAGFQRIGDWVLWVEAMAPQFIAQERQLIETLGRRSYYACHRLMGNRWLVYEELADELPRIAARVRRSLV
jgi:hypothetical protein